jgi:hypothetical protein
MNHNGGGFAAADLPGERRAGYGAAPPASRVAARSLRDGLRPPLAPEPLRPLPGQGHGQARGPARPDARRSAHTLASNPPGIVQRGQHKTTQAVTGRDVATRGANPRSSYEQQRFSLPRSTPRQAKRSNPNTLSCGIQPAHNSLTRVANDTLAARRSTAQGPHESTHASDPQQGETSRREFPPTT